MRKLSIVIVTMNRAEQLRIAISSCLKCRLPEDTAFLVIDNNSSDNTENVVKELLSDSGYILHYEKMSENIGIGKGRNYAFSKADSEYTYMLDDDAYVDYANCPDFFMKAVQVFDRNPKIATVTTEAYDTAWKRNRIEKFGRKLEDGVYLVNLFGGYSHFVRNGAFSEVSYLPNRYGYEEMPPSLFVYDKGMYNVICPELKVIHDPMINKWDISKECNHSLIILECALKYSIKKMMYPKVTHPMLKIAFERRCRKYLKNVDDWKTRSEQVIKETTEKYPVNYVLKLRTIFFVFKEFGLAIF